MKIEEGYSVYVMYNPVTGYTKIGMSENPQARKLSFESASGCPIEIKFQSHHLSCATSYENMAHEKFAEFKTIGEWFKITPDDAIAYVEEIIKNAKEDDIVERYMNGSTISSLAGSYGVTRQAILARLKKYGVYNANHTISERKEGTRIHAPILAQNPKPVKSSNITYDVSEIQPSKDILSFPDNEEPSLPLKNLRRIGSNVSFNGEWYQVSVFKDGKFIYSYTRDKNKAQSIADQYRRKYQRRNNVSL